VAADSRRLLEVLERALDEAPVVAPARRDRDDDAARKHLLHDLRRKDETFAFRADQRPRVASTRAQADAISGGNPAPPLDVLPWSWNYATRCADPATIERRFLWHRSRNY